MILISVKGNSFERVIVPDKFILTHCIRVITRYLVLMFPRSMTRGIKNITEAIRIGEGKNSRQEM